MPAHLLLPAIDSRYPAKLSRKIITGILREDLGFAGVVIFDGVAMGAISRNYDLIEATVGLVRQGKLPRDEVGASTRRVLELKARYGLLPPAR